ncbi:hypothetical protein B0H16DRAFT_1482489 [Mycena metata]|uniref:Uncharacterized protein n=1 Tax=Mycena metata TaxID=1033252 RepID=A0AAD7M7Q1_9AGAR|nr:hypothetical protein B0H16DRAFT_1482489 [Mycena metata]
MATIRPSTSEEYLELCSRITEAQALFIIAAAPADGNLTHRILMLYRARDLLGLCNMSGGSLDHNILTVMAVTYFRKTEYAEAKEIYTDVLQKTSAEQDPFNHAWCLNNLVEINSQTGQIEDSDREALGRAKAIFQMLHYPTGAIFSDIAMTDLQLNDGDVVGAYAKSTQCISSSWDKGEWVVFPCLNRLADGNCWPLEVTPSRHTWTWPITYLAWAQKFNQIIVSHWALCFLGDYFLVEEDEETARNIFAAVLDGFTQMNIHKGRAHCMLRLGDMLKRQGQRFMAEELWTVARTLFKRSMQEKNVAEIDARFAEQEPLEQESLEQNEVGAPVARVPVLGS